MTNWTALWLLRLSQILQHTVSTKVMHTFKCQNPRIGITLVTLFKLVSWNLKLVNSCILFVFSALYLKQRMFLGHIRVDLEGIIHHTVHNVSISNVLVISAIANLPHFNFCNALRRYHCAYLRISFLKMVYLKARQVQFSYASSHHTELQTTVASQGETKVETSFH
jgi:hypothetical protein